MRIPAFLPSILCASLTYALDVTIPATPSNPQQVAPYFASLAIEYFGIDNLFLTAPFLPEPAADQMTTELPKRLNLAVVQLIRNLGMVNNASVPAIIRVGGNSANRMYLTSSRLSRQAIQDQPVKEYHFKILNAVAEVTNCKFILAIGMPTPEPFYVNEIATAIKNNMDLKHILAIQVGNEPDHYEKKGTRPPGYSYATYIKEFDVYSAAIRAVLGNVDLMGPNYAYPWRDLGYQTQFITDRGAVTKYTAFHRYALRGCSDSTSLDALLNGLLFSLALQDSHPL